MKSLKLIVLGGALLSVAGAVYAGQDEFQRMRTQKVMDEKRAAEAERAKQAQAAPATTAAKDKAAAPAVTKP